MLVKLTPGLALLQVWQPHDVCHLCLLGLPGINFSQTFPRKLECFTINNILKRSSFLFHSPYKCWRKIWPTRRSASSASWRPSPRSSIVSVFTGSNSSPSSTREKVTSSNHSPTGPSSSRPMQTSSSCWWRTANPRQMWLHSWLISIRKHLRKPPFKPT